MIRYLSPRFLTFLIILALTAFVWLLRGFGVLSFLPGSVIWVLIWLCIAAAVISALP
ncbi:MAG TPA: hypothetical protein V6D18_11350 [Thermosynechococcaceae cyanobacterium]